MKHVKLCVYSVILFIYIFTLVKIYLLSYVPTPTPLLEQKFYYMSATYTVWNYIVHIAFLILAISEEVLLLRGRLSRTLKRISWWRGYLFSSLIFSCSFTTFLAFWILYSYDKNLMWEDIVDELLPLWINHSIHSVILILPIVEILFNRGDSYTNLNGALKTSVFYHVLWFSLYAFLLIHLNVALYPISHVITLWQHIYLVMSIFCTNLYFVKIGITLQQNSKIKVS